MPPTGPSTPAGPSNLKKVPPSGPRAQQGNIPSGPAAQRTPIAIPFGATKYKGPFNQPHHQNSNGGPSRGGFSPAGQFNRSGSQSFGLGHGQSNGFEHNSNGYSNSPSTHAESSRQALSNAVPRGPASESRDTHRQSGQTTGLRSRPKTPPRRSQLQDSSGRTTSIPEKDTRTPIKIAFPSSQTKATTRPKSPRLPPPPPSDRPPTPPLDAPPPPPIDRVSTPPPPPPPPEDAAPPPPEPTPSPEKKRIPAPPPVPLPLPLADVRNIAKPRISPFSLPSITNEPALKKAEPPTPATRPVSPPPPPPSPPKATPVSISLPTQSTARKIIPPAFHFREIPVRRRSPTPDSESPPPPPSEPAPPPRPPTPKEPSPPPYVPEPYVAPASVSRRPGLGNFRITFDPALDDPKKGKEVNRRFDGEGLDEVKDPRLEMSAEILKRGRGPAKNRTELQEIEYTWDSNSVGAKPLPLPSAVLLTGLNPLTTTDQIGKFLRPHGRIREMDSKMDTKSGMQLGICWVKFDTPPASSGKTAHDIAKTVVKICDGQRIRMQGDEKIRVVLDGRGLRAQKAVKEEMERRYKPKPKPVPKAAPPPSPVVATPASGADTPKTESTLPPKPTPAGLPNRPTPRPVPFFNNRDYASLGRAQPIRPTFQSKLPGRPAFGAGQGAQRTNPIYTTLPYSRPGKSIDLRDSWSPPRDRGRSRSRSRSRDGRGSRSRYRSVSRHSSHTSGCSTCPSDSEYSDDDRHYRSRGRRRAATPPKREKKPTGPSKEDEAAMEKVKKALAENGKSHIFIDETTLSTKDISTSEYLRDHFRAFHPKQILSSPKGWYILFDKEGVAQNAAILKGTVFRGKQLTFITEVAAAAANRPSDISNVIPGQQSWKYLTITKKNRTAQKPVVKKPVKKRAPSFSSSSDSSSDDDAPLSKAAPTVASSVHEQEKTKAVDDVPIKAEEPTTKKRGGRPKGSKNKKAKLDPAPLVPIPTVDETPVVEINLAPNVAKPKKAIASPIDKLIVDGTVIDEEDAYWLGQALAENEPDDEADLEEEIVPEDHPLYHTSGSWRAEGFKLISKTRKSEYLPQQNKAAVAEHDAAALTSGRTARVTGRRLAHDIDATRKATTAQTSETDTFAFNQLRTRKKQLKFSRSPIEGYGLYAMETIAPGEMVCEYVGEIVRSAIAEVREQRYLKQGIGSSYLFRIDGDVVCDATFRGSVSRLINHSCDPSASAKIITINGQSKIVIYARTMLHPGQEILYDYKFPLEDDPALRVPCLCGAATCRGWLN